MSNKQGELYVVATPIGNLGDFSPRAIDILKQVNVIFAEDTRHSRPLLQQFAISTSCQSLHEHNERHRVEEICDKLLAGEKIAIISDAGTPLISDPGFPLVRGALQKGIRVTPIAGPCAAIAALSCAGLPSDRFQFEGFLSSKAQQRKQQIENLKREIRTLVFYEAPHRIIETLRDFCEVFGGDREAVLARELTKLHETIRLMPLAELLKFVEQDPNQQKGEIVLVVRGYVAEIETDTSEIDKTLQVLLAELPLKQAVQIAVQLSGLPKNKVYDRALALKTAG